MKIPRPWRSVVAPLALSPWRRVLFFLVLTVAAGAAQGIPSEFRHEREVLPGGSGPNRIAPDVALLSGAADADLRDLRFVESTGGEVPYLLIPPSTSQPRWMPGKLLPVAATDDTSGFEVDLGAPANIDQLSVAGLPAPFLKRFRLEGSGDRSHWTLLAPEGTLFNLPAEKLQLTDAAFDGGEYRYLRVTWDDRNSGRVPQPESVSARLTGATAPPPPLRFAAEFQRLGAPSGHSRFQTRLPGAHLPIVAVELKVSETRLLRSARVTESLLAGSEVAQKTLGSATLRRVVQGELTASYLRIPIERPTGREIEIVVDDGNNPPLNLTDVDLVFAPQPWIYLETRYEPLLARYGNARLTAPRYDLEAMRQYVGRTGLKEARWGEVRDLESQPATSRGVGAETGPGAVVNTKEFRYSRPIPPATEGLTALPLDAAVLAGSRRDLRDVRIVDESDRQIPYLLERRQDPIALDLTLAPESVPVSAKESRYRVELPFESLPAAQMTLITADRVFRRRVWVEAQDTRRPQTKYGARAASGGAVIAAWTHDDPDTPAPPLTLDLNTDLGTRKLTLVVDEGDNRPLNLSSVRLDLPAYHLRFFYPTRGKLSLLYGNDTLAAPRYDLELLAPRLVGVFSREITLNPQGVSISAGNFEARVFWLALAAAALVILVLLGRLLRSEPVQS